MLIFIFVRFICFRMYFLIISLYGGELESKYLQPPALLVAKTFYDLLSHMGCIPQRGIQAFALTVICNFIIVLKQEFFVERNPIMKYGMERMLYLLIFPSPSYVTGLF